MDIEKINRAKANAERLLKAFKNPNAVDWYLVDRIYTDILDDMVEFKGAECLTKELTS